MNDPIVFMALIVLALGVGFAAGRMFEASRRRPPAPIGYVDRVTTDAEHGLRIEGVITDPHALKALRDFPNKRGAGTY